MRSHDSLSGALLGGRYLVEELLAEGGMGSVYRARDDRSGETVAIKTLQAQHVQNESMRRRFLHEARATMDIQSHNVVRIIDLGELDDGSAFYVMPFLEGKTLDEVPVDTLEDIKVIGLQICAGLAAAHAVGVVHRDLKPENIIVSRTDDGSPHCRIIDFGIAKMPFSTMLTVPGQIMGTPAYLAPEQAKAGSVVDHRSDIYALGCVLYELVAATVPFDDEDPIRIALAHLSAKPVPVREHEANCPAPLAALIMRCLEKRPEHRFPDVASVARSLSAMTLRGPLGGGPAPSSELDAEVDSFLMGDVPDVDCSRTVLVDHRKMAISVSDLLGTPRAKRITPPQPEPWGNPGTQRSGGHAAPAAGALPTSERSPGKLHWLLGAIAAALFLASLILLFAVQ
jgi:serine/threonine-protein kinase